MNGHFYLNPTTLLMKIQEHYELFSGPFQPILLNGENHQNFIETISYERAYSLEEILSYFTIEETFNLFRRNAFIDETINLEDRYSRNTCFFLLNNEFLSFEKLKEKKVLILGAGGAATHIIWAYSAMGIKNLTVLDFDKVEESNLNRQLLYEESDIGRPKIEVVKERMQEINSDINLNIINKEISSEKDLELIVENAHYDLIIAAIDEPQTVRNWINAVCVRHKIPYVGGGFSNARGMIGITYIPDVTPCMDCLEGHDFSQQSLIHGSAGAILAPIAEYVASKMAIEGMNVLIGKKETPYAGKYEMFNYQTNSSEIIEERFISECSTCKRQNETARPRDLTLFKILFFAICIILPLMGLSMPHLILPSIFSMLLVNTLLLFLKKHENIYELSFCGSSIFAILLTIAMFVNFPILIGGPNYPARIVAHVFWVISFISVFIMVFLMSLYTFERVINRFKTLFKS